MKTKAIFFQGLLYIVIYLLAWLLAHFFLVKNIDYRAGILGSTAAALALLLTPKMKVVKSQSGQRIQVTSIFIKGVKFIE
jgi:hypothetical protein